MIATRLWAGMALIVLLGMGLALGFETRFAESPIFPLRLVMAASGWLVLGMALWRGPVACGRRALVMFMGGSVTLLVMMAVYALNPTHRWEQGAGLVPLPSSIAMLPGSAYPDGTWTSLSFASMGMAAVGLSMLLGRVEVRWLMAMSVVGIGGLAAMELSRQLEQGSDVGATYGGLFVSPNHLAACLNLALPAALALGVRANCSAIQRGKLSSPSLLFFLAAAGIIAATVMLRSRAGMAIMGLILSGFVVMLWRLMRRYPFVLRSRLLSMKGVGRGLLLAGIAVVVMGAVWGGPLLGNVRQDVAFRARFWSDALAICMAHPWWGTGPGTFAVVFPYYQSESIQGLFIRHAHSEYVECLAEYGVIGCTILLAVVTVLIARQPSKSNRSEVPSFHEIEGVGLWAALIGLLLHGLIDFPMRHSLIALVALAYFGCLAGQGTPAFRRPAWLVHRRSR